MLSFGGRSGKPAEAASTPIIQRMEFTPSARSAPRQAVQAQPSPPQANAAEITRQVGEWDEMMDNIDKQQEQLLNEQWKLLRTQISSLMGALAEVRTELSDLKENVVNKEVETVIEKLIAAHDEHGENHSGMAERVAYLENFIGESADKHAQELAAHKDSHLEHKTTMETRLEFLEGLIGDSADKHSKELDAAKDKLDDLHAAISSCVHRDNHASMDTRVDYLEKFLGESADAHEKALAEHKGAADEHKTTMETRLEYIEGLLGDSSDKHAKEIGDAKDKLLDLHAAVSACAKADHHASLEERINFLEGSMGASADMHAQAIDAANSKLADLAAVKAQHHAGLQERMDYLEKFIGESLNKDDLATHKVTMEKRLEYVEGLLGDSADKHEGTQGQLEELKSVIAQRVEVKAVIETRVLYLEKLLGESAGNHEDHKTTMETRLEYIEGLIGDSADKHATEINAAKEKLKDLHSAVSACAKSEHHSSLEARLEFVEAAIGDSADEHEKTNRNLELAHSKVKDLHGKMTGDGSAIENRVERLERKLVNDSENKAQRVNCLEMNYGKIKSGYDELNDIFHLEKANRDHNQTRLIDRLMPIEKMFNELVPNHTSQLDVIQTSLRSITSRVGNQSTMLDNHKATMEQRLARTEGIVDQNSGASMQLSESLKQEIEQRFFYLQEDQKRARDALESSFAEQLHLEHSAHEGQAAQIKEMLDRELRGRQSYQEQYKELLAHERVTRESAEQVYNSRVTSCETNSFNEMQRLWVAVEGHTHDGLVAQDYPPPAPIIVQSPRPQSIVVQSPQPQPQYRVAGQLYPTVLAPTSVQPMFGQGTTTLGNMSTTPGAPGMTLANMIRSPGMAAPGALPGTTRMISSDSTALMMQPALETDYINFEERPLVHERRDPRGSASTIHAHDHGHSHSDNHDHHSGTHPSASPKPPGFRDVSGGQKKDRVGQNGARGGWK